MNTVDLSEKIKEQKQAAIKAADFVPPANKKILSKPLKKNARISRANEIDKVFDGRDDLLDEELQKIDRPKGKKTGEGDVYKKISIILLLAIIIGSGYLFFHNKKNPGGRTAVNQENSGWYSVKLSNGEVYYGQIADLGADPVVIENVYYNYDQLSADAGGGEKPDSGNLRLVKRGQEIHGPDGSLSVVRSQVVYMEPMKEDSKVLKAILEYEK